jgi:uncharacterized protein (DUF58 family)
MKRQTVITAILIILLALALFGGLTLLWRFFLFLVVLLWLSRAWSRWNMRGITARSVKSADHRQIGELFEEEFTVTNNSRLPVPGIEVEEITNLPGYQNKITFNLAAHDSFQWHTRPYCQRRGQYPLGELIVKIADPLGIFVTRERLGESQSIIVYPPTLELPHFEIIPRREQGQSIRRWFASESGPIASRVREYTSGDSLRRIHWQTTAHLGKLVVKEFDPDRSHFNFKDIWLVVDGYHATRLGKGEENTEEYSVTAAASLAKKFIREGKRVGLITSGEKPFICLSESGNRQLQNILRALALMKSTGKVPIEDLLNFQSERFQTGSVVVVIMSSENQNIIPPLRQAMNRGITFVAVLLDSLSFGGGTTAADMARTLISAGFSVYVIRRGRDIQSALDSRWLTPIFPEIGDRLVRV